MTKDEALRVAREALTKARSCVDATVSKEHAAWAHELDSALRTIALAVEGPSEAVQSVALGDPTEKLRRCPLRCLEYGQCKANMHGVPSECAASASGDLAAAALAGDGSER